MAKLLKFPGRSGWGVAAAGLLGLLAATQASAGDSVSVTVNATVTGVCLFNVSTATLNLTNIGSGSQIDPSNATSATGSLPIAYRCSNGTAPVFTVPASLTLNNGSDSMAATIAYTGGGPGTGMGNTAANQKTLTINGSIAQTIFQDKPAGIYTNTMTVSINPCSAVRARAGSQAARSGLFFRPR